MRTENHVLVKIIFTNGIKVGLPLRIKVEKTDWRHTNSPVKKKFWALRLIKKIMLNIFRDMKGPMSIDFLEKEKNCKQCCQLPPPEAKFTLFIE